jgi:DNA phosphorothioation-associated putative methyltransferase
LASQPHSEIVRRSTDDLLVYLALGRFRRRPPMSALPTGLQRDIPAFFGSYANGCRRADDRLFRSGDSGAVDDACRRSAVGKLLHNALYVHRTAREALDPLLRVYEGCARPYLGEIEGADLIKLHRQSGKISYLVYPDFDADPHPALLRSIKLNLRTREIESSDYTASANPPIPHRKETFLRPDDPRAEVRPPDPPVGAGRADGRARGDRHPGRLGRPAAGAGIRPPRASAGAVPGGRWTGGNPIG